MNAIELSHIYTAEQNHSRTRNVPLRDVTMSVANEDICLFVGKSGSGTTEALAVASGQVIPTCGTVRIFGKPYGPQCECVGALVGRPPLFQSQTIRANLLLRCISLGIPHAQNHVDSALRTWDLTPNANEKMSVVSEGIQQRTRIAWAHIGDPNIVLLDNPLHSLDVAEQRRIQQKIQSNNAIAHTTYIITSHDIDPWIYIATSIVVMDGGQIVRHMSAKTLRHALGTNIYVHTSNSATTLVHLSHDLPQSTCELIDAYTIRVAHTELMRVADVLHRYPEQIIELYERHMETNDIFQNAPDALQPGSIFQHADIEQHSSSDAAISNVQHPSVNSTISNIQHPSNDAAISNVQDPSNAQNISNSADDQL